MLAGAALHPHIRSPMSITAKSPDTRHSTPPLDALRAIVAPFEQPDERRAWLALLTSVPPYIATWYAMDRALGVSYWLTLALALVAGGFVVRTFIVQHDCGHGSFFRSARLRVAVGRACSLITLIPYGYFRRYHGAHHATSGKLHDRGVDIETLTVREYLALAPAARRRYRIMRHPVVLFVISPMLYFAVAMRMPKLARPGWRRERRSILLTDVALAVLVATLVTLVGVRSYLLVQLPITVVASTTGMWLFYVQHQFEDTYWADAGEWDFGRAALEGSSYYAMPAILEWFTGYIGLHHVHHLSPRVPSYRLTDCHESSDVLASVPRLTLRDALGTMRLKLWDEEQGRLVGWP